MLFDLTVHIVATGDNIILDGKESLRITETEGFTANSGGLSISPALLAFQSIDWSIYTVNNVDIARQ